MSQVQAGTDISFMARVGYAVNYVLSGAWFGPQTPLKPLAPPEVKGRAFDYRVGINLEQTPRGGEWISFPTLRQLANNWDVLRGCIEQRKDEIISNDWEIRVKPKLGSKKEVTATADQQARIEAITEFMESPDKELTFEQWLRALLEDHYVIDAPTIYLRPTLGGDTFALELIDGATIHPLLADDGRRPIPPDPAYQQILKGIPAADYTQEELLYGVQNVRTNHVYGLSRVERVVMTINIAIRRAMFNVNYYDEGTVPDGFGTLPKEWDLKQIKGFQDWFDSILSGQLGMRRKLRFMPEAFKYTEAKAPPFKDEYDDYLTRVVCFIFGISPNGLVKGNNRAVSETQHQEARATGLIPDLRWLKHDIFDKIIRTVFQSPDLEWNWVDDSETDPAAQAIIDKTYVEAGIYSINEVREARGGEGVPGLADELLVYTAMGYVTLGGNIAPEEGGTKEPPPVPVLAGPDGKGAPSAGSAAPAAGASGGAASAAKRAIRKQVQNAGAKKSITLKARHDITKRIYTALKALAPIAAKTAVHGLAKADDPTDGIDLTALNISIVTSADDLKKVARSSGSVALATLGVKDRSELVNQVNQRAGDWATERAAELVGKRVLEDGSIIDNPNAAYRIDETTRTMIRATIASGLEGGKTKDEIASDIEKSFAFSEDRAELIARTEIGNANSAGALVGFKTARDDAGVNVKKAWAVDGDPCPICTENGDAGAIDLDDDFPSGDDAPLAHPNCECALIPVVGDEDEA